MDAERPDPPDQPSQPDQPGQARRGPAWSGGWDTWPFPTGLYGASRAPANPWGTTSSWGPANLWGPFVERVVSVVKSRWLGKRLTVSTATGDVGFTLTELDARADSASLARGQLGDVTAVVADLDWREIGCERAVATLRNTHVQGGASPHLVAAPVELRVVLGQADLDRLVAAHGPDVRLEITPDRGVVARWGRHPDWGHVEVDAGADGTRIWVRPRRLVRGGRSVGLPRRLPPISFRLGLPAERVTLLSIETQEGRLELRARVDEVRVPLGSSGPERLLRRLGDLGSRIDLSTWTR